MINETLSTTLSKSTSPHNLLFSGLRLTPTSITTAPSLTISAVTNLGLPKAAIKMGEGNKEAANKILGNCFIVTFILAIILTIVIQLFKTPILYMFGASDNTIIYAYDYISIYAWGTVFVMISLGLNAFITTQGYSKVSMINVMIGAGVNIILDPLFIYGFNLSYSQKLWRFIKYQKKIYNTFFCCDCFRTN